MSIKKQFEAEYRKIGKHRKKCIICNRLIQDGAKVKAMLIQSEKFYPIKGIMKFNSWKFQHANC